MKFSPRAAVVIWLAVVVACAGWLYRNLSVGADLTVFLPPSTNAAQRILVSQLRDGVAARLILIGLEGGNPAALAQASRELARQLKASGRFGFVNNGDLSGAAKERELLVAYRYLVSPGVTAERFTAAGLAASLKESLALLASPAGPFVRNSLPFDPTGESRQVIEFLVPESGPEIRDGVWFSRDGTRALLVAETVAAGFDIEGQAQAIQAIRDALPTAEAKGIRLLLSGLGVFAAEARATIQSEARPQLRVGPGPSQRDSRRLGPDHGRCGGQPVVRSGPWHHARFRGHADRRGSGLPELRLDPGRARGAA